VVGAVPCDYVPLHPADDLARCFRYYQRWQSPGNNAVMASGQCFSTTGWDGVVSSAAKLAVAPTFTISALSDFAMLQAGGTNVPVTGFAGQTNPIGVSLINITTNVASGLVGGNASLLMANSANAWFAVEANP